MPGALIVLACAVDHHRDAAEILQAADIDRGRRLVAAVLHPDTGYVVEETAERARLTTLDLLQRHHGDGSQRVDGALLGLRGRHRDRIE